MGRPGRGRPTAMTRLDCILIALAALAVIIAALLGVI
jgi:hypothetical protein